MPRRWRLLFEEAVYVLRAHRRNSPAGTLATQCHQLESRILMSATPVALPAAESAEAVTMAPDDTPPTGPVTAESGVDGNAPAHQTDAAASESAADRSVELVIIDPSADDFESLIADLESQVDRDIRILLLDEHRDGIRQITEALDELESVSALHLVSHGSDGSLRLGTSVLNHASLNDYVAELGVWRETLSGNRDLLIYGCDFASGDTGRDFVQSLGALTLADIAASTDPTGATRLGGDWDLEYRFGNVEAGIAFTQSIQQTWDGILASTTIFATQTDDIVNGDTSSVAALLTNDGGDGISLREAILAANQDSDTHTIVLSAGTYRLTNSGNGNSRGDLDVYEDLIIVGAGADLTMIHGNGTDRIFELKSADVQLERLTVTGGVIYGKGGGIRVDYNSELTLTDVAVTGNWALDDGGGISVDGQLTANRVEFSGNSAADRGGAIHLNAADDSFLTNVTVSGNTSGNGGVIHSKNSKVTITNSTVAFNDEGFSKEYGNADIRLQNSIVANNTDGNSQHMLTSLGNNIDDDGSAGLNDASDQNNVDPLLDATLSLNGGTTRTHALLAGSTAIDQGNNAAAPTYDQRRWYRDGLADIGAYEANVSAPGAPTELQIDTVLIDGGIDEAIGGTLTTVDADSPAGHVYTVDDVRFEIVNGQLKLKNGITLDRSTEPSVSVNVTSTDVDGNELTQAFVLTVTHPPIILGDDTTTLDADQPNTTGAPGVLGNDVNTTNDVTAGAILNYDAGQDTDGDGTWTDTTGVSGFDWTFGTGVTRNDNPTTGRTGILGAWTFDGSGTGGAINSDSFQDLAGDPTDSSATFEIWIRPTDAVGQEVIFETGTESPTGTGMSLRLNGSDIEWLIHDPATGNSVVVDIAAEIASGEFIQIAGTITVTGTDTVMELFINGASVGSATVVGVTDWSDNQETGGLGVVDGTASFNSAGTQPFAGEIAIFRLYDAALSGTEVQTNFDAVAGTATGLTVDSVDTTGTTGIVTVQPDGTWTYDPDGQFDHLAEGQTATDSFTYTVTDGTTTETATVTITITGVNEAPVLTSDTGNIGIIEADETSSEVAVGTILSGLVTDSDDGAVQGAAITGISGAGVWEYSTDGTNWQTIGLVSDTSALLLRSTDLVRYSGDGFTGETATISYRAWDQTDTTTGQHGTMMDVTTFGTGGQSPFSLVENTSSLDVLPINASAVGHHDTYEVDEDGTLNVDDTSGWHHAGWSHRQELFFNNAAQAGDLTDVPVLIRLHANAADAINIDYSLTQDGGEDLRFVDANGDPLDYEIEAWDENGYSFVWVQVPQIDGASIADSIWMYYGNSGAPAGQNSTAVWDNNNVAVLHLNGDAGDSTSGAHHGIDSGTTSATGQIGEGRLFDGTDDRINLGKGGSLDSIFAGGGTISAWINPSGWGENDYGRIADKAADENGNGGWAIQIHGTTPSNGYIRIEHGFDGTRGVWETSPGSLALGSMQHVVISYDNSSAGNVPVVYVNGVAQAVSIETGPVGNAVSDAANDLVVGNYSQNTTRTFDGIIDEFRVFSETQSADRVAALFAAESGIYVTSSGVVKATGGVTANDTDAENDTLTVTVVSGPSQAESFVLNADGSFEYTPVADFHGIDTFTYELNDGTDISGPYTVTINVNPVGDTPHVTDADSDDGQQTTSGLAITRNTVDGVEVTHYRITGIIGGTLYQNDGTTVIADGNFITAAEGAAGLKFTPDVGYSGEAYFDVQASVSDNVTGLGGGVATATICVRCVPFADPIPDVVAQEDDLLTQLPLDGYFSVPQGETLTFSLAVLSGEPNIFSTLSIDPVTGVLSFKSGSNQHGFVQLRVTATDSAGAFASSDFSLTVQPVQDRPTAGNHTYYLTDSQTIAVGAPGVLSTASDADGELVTAVLQADVTVGTLTLNPDGSFTYTSPAGFSGQVTFTYVADDGIEQSTAATVTFEVGIGGGGAGGSRAGGDGGDSGAAEGGDGDSGAGEGEGSPQEGESGDDSQSSDGGTTDASAGAGAVAATASSDEKGSNSAETAAQNVGTIGGELTNPGSENDEELFRERAEAAAAAAGSLQRSSDSDNTSISDAIALRESIHVARAQFFAQFSQDGLMWRHLDDFGDSVTHDLSFERTVIDGVTAVSSGLAVGSVIWAIRGGVLLSGLLAQMPVWTMLDPLMIIDGVSAEEGDSLQDIVDQQNHPDLMQEQT